MAILMIADPYDPATGATTRLYSSDTGFTTGRVDMLANTYFVRRIDAAPTVTRSLWSGTRVGGYSRTNYGQVVLGADKGALAPWARFVWGGRSIELLDLPSGGAFADAVRFFKGQAAAFTPTRTGGTIDLRDLQALVEGKFSPGAYDGTGGIGGPASLKEKKRPFAGGRVREGKARLLDGVKNIYQWHAGGVDGVELIRDKGDPLDVVGPDYADYAALAAADLSTAGPGGTPVDYTTCNALGLFRLRATPQGEPRVTGRGAKVGGVWLQTFGQLAEYILGLMAPTLPLRPASWTAIGTASTATLSWYFDGDRDLTIQQAIDELAASDLIWWNTDEDGLLDVGRFDLPAAADITLDAREIDGVTPRKVAQRIKKQTIGYAPLAAAYSEGDLVPTMPAADRDRLLARTLTVAWTDPSPVDLLATEENLDAPLDGVTAAQALADRYGALFGIAMAGFDVDLPRPVDGVRLGKTVRIAWPEYLLDGGWSGVVIETRRSRKGPMRMTLVGPQP
ncbi:MAG TPA: hypothetical protein VD995_03015 [Azospirillum sp.]|nr:hypothetical protein [Azospirillum sp.]